MKKISLLAVLLFLTFSILSQNETIIQENHKSEQRKEYPTKSLLNPPTNLIGYNDINNVVLLWDAPDNDSEIQTNSPAFIKDFLGYTIYMDGNSIAYTTEPTHTIESIGYGIYEFCVIAVYDEGESDCSNSITIITLYTNYDFFDDFESYNSDEQLACQNPNDWTTWSDDPCGLEDTYISNMYAYSGDNSVNVITDNDLVYELGVYPSWGSYWIRMMIYIPTDNGAYYSVLSEFNGGVNPEWAFEIYFNNTGDGYVNAGGSYAATFNYSFDNWMSSDLFVDLDNDLAWYYLNGILVYEWQWTLGSGGNGSQLQLAGVDFFGNLPSTSYYFDDFKIEDLVLPGLAKPLNLSGPNYVSIGEDINLTWDSVGFKNEVQTGYEIKKLSFPQENKDLNYYNIYRNGLVIGTSTELEYNDNIDVLGTYIYCVTAVYEDIGESMCSNEWLVEVLPLTSINENPSIDIKIFPNPASNIVNIQSDLNISNVKVYNYSGQIIKDEKADSKFYQINTSQFESGIYFFRIETEEGVISERIVVQ